MRPSTVLFLALTSSVFAAPIVLPPGTDISGPAGLPKARLHSNVEDKREEDYGVTWKREADGADTEWSGTNTWKRQETNTWKRAVEPSEDFGVTWKRTVKPSEDFGVTWKRVIEPSEDFGVTWKRVEAEPEYTNTWKREGVSAQPDSVLPGGGQTWKREEPGTDSSLPGQGGDWKREVENDSN